MPEDRLSPGAVAIRAGTNLTRNQTRARKGTGAFIPNVRPPVIPPLAPPANPTQRVNSPAGFFRGPRIPSAFNLTPEELRLTPQELTERRRIQRLHLRQRNAAEAVEQNPHANHVIQLNESAGGLAGTPGAVVGGRMHRKRNYGKTRKARKLRTRKHK